MVRGDHYRQPLLNCGSLTWCWPGYFTQLTFKINTLFAFNLDDARKSIKKTLFPPFRIFYGSLIPTSNFIAIKLFADAFVLSPCPTEGDLTISSIPCPMCSGLLCRVSQPACVSWAICTYNIVANASWLSKDGDGFRWLNPGWETLCDIICKSQLSVCWIVQGVWHTGEASMKGRMFFKLTNMLNRPCSAWDCC